jgi:hypothetical protein
MLQQQQNFDRNITNNWDLCHCNNGYANAPQSYVIIKKVVLFYLILLFDITSDCNKTDRAADGTGVCRSAVSVICEWVDCIDSSSDMWAM